MIGFDPFETADPDVVTDNDHDGSEDCEADCEDAGRLGDGEGRVRNCDSRGAPCGDGGHSEGAVCSFYINDARIGGSEELEHGWGKENGDDGADTLGHPLEFGGCAEQEASSEIGDQVSGLVGAHGGKSSTEEIEALGVLDAPSFALGSATEDDLGGFGGGGEGSDIRYTSALDGEESEEEGERREGAERSPVRSLAPRPRPRPSAPASTSSVSTRW